MSSAEDDRSEAIARELRSFAESCYGPERAGELTRQITELGGMIATLRARPLFLLAHPPAQGNVREGGRR